MNPVPIFSLCHTTKRLNGWQKAKRAWIEAADHPELLEHILCIDAEDKQAFAALHREQQPLDRFVVNEKRPCAVDGWNAAAAVAQGQILITVADDWFPPKHWDSLLCQALGNIADDKQAVVWVATGGNRNLMTFSILTRAYYDRYGYIFYPEYIGMMADDDFTATAIKDGVVIDCRDTLPVFQHLHPEYGTAETDSIYARQHREEAWEVGRRIFRKRFGVTQTIAVCLPGESFSNHWVCAWTELLAHLLQRGFQVFPCFNYTSNVYFTRQALAQMVMGMTVKPSYVLWIDDDQILSPAGFDTLESDLRVHPEVDVVGAWSWIQDDSGLTTVVSAGIFTPDGSAVEFLSLGCIERAKAVDSLIEVEWTGFPALLMRAGVIEKAAENAKQRNGVANPFCPIPAPNSPWGVTTEDSSFCINAKDAGCKVFIDARVFVPHLKLRSIAPGVVKDVGSEQSLVCMEA